jgi:hypothetical protein
VLATITTQEIQDVARTYLTTANKTVGVLVRGEEGEPGP